jgi:fructosamine-3-kinase
MSDEEAIHPYNLYHLVNHLNHFGERYSEAVDAVLRRYVS